jgi:hypothetical protein
MIFDCRFEMRSAISNLQSKIELRGLVSLPRVVEKWLPTIIVLVTCPSWLFGQNPQLRLKNAGRFPTVIFSSVRWNADPSYYSIAIDASGTATYQSAPKGIADSGVAYTIEFQVSDRTRRIAFNLAQRLDYFAGDFGESRSTPNQNKVQTLAYRYESVNNQFTYSSSPDPDIVELTSVFEELSQTFEFGRKLSDLALHNRRGIPSQLQSMQEKADRHALRDLPALLPILRELASDAGLDPAVRKQAATLIAMASKSPQGFQ